ncbi:MAG: polyribonucleotide nucleotidyltransferase [Candidatus Omnitrophica bacterium]|nr:polyribonucleotide nucleotidyltransferase [Candidatus Omnitrophota bacterium]
MKTSKAKALLGAGEITFETGDLAKQANGSVLVQLNGTVILVTACMSKEPREDIDFFPLLVDYQEKTYAAGRIPGGFFKREGRPKDIEILTARLVDRSIRPLFPEGVRNNVQVVCVVLSSDAENDPDVLAINGASAALSISDIPFSGPIAAVRVIKTNQGFLVNPTYQQRAEAVLDLVISANSEKILMIEAKAYQASEEDALEAIKLAHASIKEVIKAQEKLKQEAGKQKSAPALYIPDEEMFGWVKEKTKDSLSELYEKKDKELRDAFRKDLLENLAKDPKFQEQEVKPNIIKDCFEKIEKEFVRKKILNEKIRPDGRKPQDLRSITCQVGILPRTHGSALFTRGQTQSLAVTTLGTSSDEQMIEALQGQTYKHFMLHYTFPPFSVGETSPLRGPSRRETGHGALAEKSLSPVIPTKEEFPYTIRVVSEILESNGSSSMASVCAASLSLMDAGVPIKDPIAGVALGLIAEGESYLILVDIAGLEDHHGDMDFKVAGTKEGITSIQLDLKIQGINLEILNQGLKLAKNTRQEILKKMIEALNAPREKVSQFAPKITRLKINIDKVGELIGPGGRTIKRIISQAGVAIDIDDEKGEVTISAADEASLAKGVGMVEEIIRELEVGKIYKATVAKITNFGAFCDIGPTKSGLLHVSEISNNFVKNVYDELKEGDEIQVMVINIDEQGRVNLSKKQAERRANEKEHN